MPTHAESDSREMMEAEGPLSWVCKMDCIPMAKGGARSKAGWLACSIKFYGMKVSPASRLRHSPQIPACLAWGAGEGEQEQKQRANLGGVSPTRLWILTFSCLPEARLQEVRGRCNDGPSPHRTPTS